MPIAFNRRLRRSVKTAELAQIDVTEPTPGEKHAAIIMASADGWCLGFAFETTDDARTFAASLVRAADVLDGKEIPPAIVEGGDDAR